MAPTFRPTVGQLCSSISQHNCHPRSGHDFHKELGNNRLTHSQIITHIVNPTHKWVSQAIQLSQYTIGFHRILRQWLTHIKTQSNQHTSRFFILLRQWKGRISKLVSSTWELWTPTQDLAWPPRYLTTQNKEMIPFAATRSLGPYLPFQCSSGCA